MASYNERLADELVSLCQSHDQALFEHRLDGYEKDDELEFLRRHHLIVSAETAKRLAQEAADGIPSGQLPQWIMSIQTALRGWNPPESFDVNGDVLWGVLTSELTGCVCHLAHYHRCAAHPRYARLSKEHAREVATLDQTEQNRWRDLFFKHLLLETYRDLQDSGALQDPSPREC